MKKVLISVISALTLVIQAAYADGAANFVNQTACQCIGDPQIEIFKPICKINNAKALNIEVKNYFGNSGSWIAPGERAQINLVSAGDFSPIIFATGGNTLPIKFYTAKPNNTYYVTTYTTKFGDDFLVIKLAPQC